MKNLPKTLPLLWYGDATKNVINQISHILHRSTPQPCLQILPLPPLLPQTQNVNFQDQTIPSISVASPRVGPVSQPLRVKLNQLLPTPPPIIQLYTSPSLDPDPNPWIKKISKCLKSPQIPKARETQAAPRQVQHRLCLSSLNFRKNVLDQAAQHLVVNHIFNFPHAFHIYNKQSKRNTADTLLLGKDSDTWWKAVGNKLGRIANGIDNGVRSTNTIKLIKKEELPPGRTVTYDNFVCNYRPPPRNGMVPRRCLSFLARLASVRRPRLPPH